MDSTAHKIIPDIVLEEAICLVCLKYLTVSPIGVHTHGTTTCGRCTKSPKPSLTLLEYYGGHTEYHIPLTLLGYASSRNYLFPCINRFEGCSTVLPYQHIRQHEDNCYSEEKQCCLCNFEGVGTQLVEHFKRNHDKNLLTGNSTLCIDLSKNIKEMCLYKTSKSLFIIKFHFVADLTLFMIQIQYLSSQRKRRTRIKCSIHLFTGDGDSYNTNLLTDTLSISNNYINMNFRINDLKMIDFDDLNLAFVILDE